MGESLRDYFTTVFFLGIVPFSPPRSPILSDTTPLNSHIADDFKTCQRSMIPAIRATLGEVAADRNGGECGW